MIITTGRRALGQQGSTGFGFNRLVRRRHQIGRLAWLGCLSFIGLALGLYDGFALGLWLEDSRPDAGGWWRGSLSVLAMFHSQFLG